MAAAYVMLSDVQVMYVESSTGPAGAARAFDTLEARLPSLKGRKFYGTFQPPAGPYRRGKVADWDQNLPEIGKTFQRMSQESEHDASRPSIEFYRSQRSSSCSSR